MKIFKAVIALVVMFAFLSTQNLTLLFAHGPAGPRGYVVLAETHIEKNKVELDASFIRISDDKVAVIVRTPKRSKAKVQSLYLEDPSGKKYKPISSRTMPYDKLESYLDSVAISKGSPFKRFYNNLEGIVVTEAHASCGHCGGTGPASRPAKAEDKTDYESYVKLMGLIAVAAQVQAIWITVFIFRLQPLLLQGIWLMKMAIYVQGRMFRIREKINFSPPKEAPAVVKPPKETPKPKPTTPPKAPLTPPKTPVPVTPPDPKLPRASAYNPDTGITTTSQGNPDGSRTVTKTDRKGNVISRETIPAKRPPSASSYDPDTGITTTSKKNPDGSRTITKTDERGKVISEEKVPAKRPPSASSYNPDTGITTTSQGNPDGSRTVTQTDSQGNVISQRTVR
jgi:hypothetical protein